MGLSWPQGAPRGLGVLVRRLGWEGEAGRGWRWPPAAAGAPGWSRGREQADNCGLVGTEGRTRPWGPVLRSLWLGQAAAGGRAGAPGPARPRVSRHRVRACAHVRGAAQCRPPSPQELLAEWQLRQGSRGVCGRLRRAALLALVWLLCLGITFGCTVAVYVFSELLVEVRGRARGLGVRTPAWVEWAPSDPSDPARTPGGAGCGPAPCTASGAQLSVSPASASHSPLVSFSSVSLRVLRHPRPAPPPSCVV